jgi:integrase
MPKLTEAAIRKAVAAGAVPGKPYTMIWDADPTGLGLRIRASGSHSWLFRYRPKTAGRGAAPVSVTLGAYPSLDLATARTAAKKLAIKIVDGGDPAAAVRQEKTREKCILSTALDEYVAAMKRRKIVNAATNESTLKRGLAAFMGREVADLTRADLVGAVKKVEAAGKPGAATELRKCTRTLLEWSVSEGLVQFNVLAGLRMPKPTRAERLADEGRKGRALTDDEIRTVWTACGKPKPLHGLIKLGLLTALRRSELAGLKWSDVQDDRIVVEAHRAKTGERHEVPLTAAMRAVLNAQPRTTSSLVFGSSRKPSVVISGWSKLVPLVSKAAGIDFRLHDLRRTARTIMSRLGVQEDHAELAIGHARSDLVGRYNKDDAWQARVDAFKKVSDHVSSLIGGDAPTVRSRPKKKAPAPT